MSRNAFRFTLGDNKSIAFDGSLVRTPTHLFNYYHFSKLAAKLQVFEKKISVCRHNVGKTLTIPVNYVKLIEVYKHELYRTKSQKNETVICKAKMSRLILIPSILFGAVILWLFSTASSRAIKLIFFVVAWIPTLRISLLLLNTKLAVTSERVFGKYGILGLRTIDFPIDKIDNISCDTNLFGYILNYRKITLCGTSGSTVGVKYVVNALKFKDAVLEAINRYHEDAQKAQAAEIAAMMSEKN